MEPAEPIFTPLNWRSFRIRHLLNDYFGGSWGNEPDERKVENVVRVIRVTEFDMTRLRVSDNIPTIRSLALDENSVAYVRQGDIILEKSGGGEKTPVGRAVVMTDPPAAPTINSNFTNLLRPKPSVVDSRFLIYTLYSSYHSGQTKRNIKQTTGIQNLDVSGFIDERLLVPPLHEQQLISRYLDKKTAQIDSLIERIEKKIELLKEQRTSLINQCVTKGLDPNVEMKDSGVEWIGKIPKHWRSKPIKYLVSMSGGGTPSTETAEYWDGEIPWVSPKDMKSDTISATEDYITDKGLRESTSNLVDPGALLIVFRSGILQRTIPIAINSVPVSINQDIKALNSINHDFDIQWLFWFVRGNEINLLFVWSKKGATVESLEAEYLLGTNLPVPPKDEQIQIIKEIDKVHKRTEKLVEHLQSKRELLSEYRQSLISSVVTGKIRVTEDMV